MDPLMAEKSPRRLLAGDPPASPTPSPVTLDTFDRFERTLDAAIASLEQIRSEVREGRTNWARCCKAGDARAESVTPATPAAPCSPPPVSPYLIERAGRVIVRGTAYSAREIADEVERGAHIVQVQSRTRLSLAAIDACCDWAEGKALPLPPLVPPSPAVCAALAQAQAQAPAPEIDITFGDGPT